MTSKFLKLECCANCTFLKYKRPKNELNFLGTPEAYCKNPHVPIKTNIWSVSTSFCCTYYKKRPNKVKKKEENKS